MSHVFISYSHQDSDYAKKYAAELERRGFDVWIDERIDYGDRWFKEISKEIRDCAAFSVIMTPAAEESEWVEREILVAQKHKKPIFPLLLEGREFDLLITTQYADVRGGNFPDDDFFAKLGRFSTPAASSPATLVPASNLLRSPGGLSIPRPEEDMSAFNELFLRNKINEHLTALMNAVSPTNFVLPKCQVGRIRVTADLVTIYTIITSNKDDPLMLPLPETWRQVSRDNPVKSSVLSPKGVMGSVGKTHWFREWPRDDYAERLNEIAKEIITVNNNFGVPSAKIDIECTGL